MGQSESTTTSHEARDEGLRLVPVANLLSRRNELLRLDLSGNPLDEGGLSALVGLGVLQQLTLARCGFTAFPSWTMRLPQLQRLDLSKNRIAELPLAALTDGAAAELQCLILSHNRLRRLPEELWALPSLLMVRIDGNAIDVASPALASAEARERTFGAAQQRVAQEILPGLWLGSKFAAGCEGPPSVCEELRRRGVTHVLTLGGGMDPPFPEAFAYRVIDRLQDTPTADIASVFDRAFDFIDEARAAGGAALVHCNQGQSRSATVVAAYVARERGLAIAEDAVLAVEEKRYVVDPNPGFRRQLQEFCGGIVGVRVGAPAAEVGGDKAVSNSPLP